MKTTRQNPKPESGYRFPAEVRIVCPKCGNLSRFAVAGHGRAMLEYAGVCGANSGPGQWCDAMLTLQVTAHLRPNNQEHRDENTS